MPDWIRKPGTTAHPIQIVLTDSDKAMDLPVDTTVMFRAKSPGASTLAFNAQGSVVAAGANIDNPDRGAVSYAFQPSDLAIPGIYEVDVVATIPGLGTQVFPEDGYWYLLILEGTDDV